MGVLSLPQPNNVRKRGGIYSPVGRLSLALSGALALSGCSGFSGLISDPGGNTPKKNGGNTIDLTAGDPGHVGPARLTRDQYTRTMQDLFSSEQTPGDLLPTDGLGSNGFPNQAESLTLSDAHVQGMLTGAENLVGEAFSRGPVTDGSWGAVLPCDWREMSDEGKKQCAYETLEGFAFRAWRRPLSDQEKSEIRGYYDQEAGNETWEESITRGLMGILLSPQFIYHVNGTQGDGEKRELDPYSLASRLSYTVWGTMPDELLFDSAKSGDLIKEEELLRQVDRMLDDPRATEALVDSFFMNWLRLGPAANNQFGGDHGARLTGELRAAILAELNRFAEEILFGDYPITELLLHPTLYVNDTLAAHYGMAAPGSATELVAVDASLAQGGRQGIFGLAGFYMAISNSLKTGATHRGLVVLEVLLDRAPPPPPADVLAMFPDVTGDLAPREFMAIHRADPACAACHNLMDPVGFGLETYDPIGTYVSEYAEFNNQPRPTDGVYDGQSFDSVAELSEIIAASDDYPRAMMKHLMGYFAGRKITGSDDSTVEIAIQDMRENGNTFRDAIRAVVKSVVFRGQEVQEGGGTCQ